MKQQGKQIHYKLQDVKNLTIPLISTVLLLAACGGGTPVDTTAPVVSLAVDFPATPGTAILTATANEPVSKIEFYWNGTLISTDTTAPYSATIDVDQRQNGSVVLLAKAYNLAGDIGVDSIAKMLNINTLYQGQWGWITFTDPQNVEGSMQDDGIVFLNDQFLSSNGKTIAYGGYYAAQPNQIGDAYLGDFLNDGSTLMDLVYPQSEQSYLTAIDEDGLSMVDGDAVFLGYAELYTADGALQKDLYIGMVQLNTDPYAGSSISAQSIKSQSSTHAKAETLTALKTLVSEGKLNSLSKSVASRSIQRLNR